MKGTHPNQDEGLSDLACWLWIAVIYLSTIIGLTVLGRMVL